MSDSIGLYLGIIASFFAIIISIDTIIKYSKSKYFLDSKIHFKPTLISDEDIKINTDPKKSEIRSIIFLNDNGTIFDRYINIPFTINNKSNKPIKNIRIQLEYKKSFYINNDEIVNVSKSKSIPQIDKEGKNIIYAKLRNLDDDEIGEIKKLRQTYIFGDSAYESLEIPILRPLEGITIPYYFVLGKKPFDNDTHLYSSDYGFKNISNKLNEINELINFFVINIHIYSEDYRPINKLIKVFEVTGSNEDIFLKTLKKISKAFWLGKFPKSGSYWIPYIPGRKWFSKYKGFPKFSQNFISYEPGVASKTEFIKITTPEKKDILVNVIEMSDLGIFRMSLPNCNYYRLPASVDSFESLMKYMGVPTEPIFVTKKYKKINDDYNDKAGE